jgi:hypothetical protein
VLPEQLVKLEPRGIKVTRVTKVFKAKSVLLARLVPPEPLVLKVRKETREIKVTKVFRASKV